MIKKAKISFLKKTGSICVKINLKFISFSFIVTEFKPSLRYEKNLHFDDVGLAEY